MAALAGAVTALVGVIYGTLASRMTTLEDNNRTIVQPMAIAIAGLQAYQAMMLQQVALIQAKLDAIGHSTNGALTTATDALARANERVRVLEDTARLR